MARIKIRVVEIAGYCPSSLFYVVMDQDEAEVHYNANKRTKLISGHFDQTSLVKKDLLYSKTICFGKNNVFIWRAGKESQLCL